MLVDVAFGQWTGTDQETVLVPAWVALTAADFSFNAVTVIDESVVSGNNK